MRRLIGIAVATTLGMAAFAGVAEARDGCGIGWHMGIYGSCMPNPGVPVYRAPAVPVVVYPQVVEPAYPVVELPRVYNPNPPRYVTPPTVVYYP